MVGQVSVRKQLLGTLCLLATSDSYRSVGERFDIAKSSLCVNFMRIVEALNDIAGDVIEWPRGEKATHVKQQFQQIAGLPNVLGAIDGSYIEIKAPKTVLQAMHHQ
ncbi:protein ANTAGONIST OF LIKE HETEROCHROMATIN PROTEIN 1-like isoform X2 [Harpegnathos saltator]|uniref:protein ANTAGONIST OF LIKE HETEROCHROMATIN PROTEIN 1-like isoform X2 n=1 Tax=Harpegnathos saltator TaxID=610380 RepID=UPI00058F0477|nr:protein ANTAGONIST OF LIKE HETEROCHROMATIN PROTEIN 1-like isoform X2 [Harpegnathos saltator]XP_011141658.1 protein ANTAGONIST OF LIKE HETEROCHROMATIN PROTEIN 1-like isoform X2 [Harpegnathos saltator]